MVRFRLKPRAGVHRFGNRNGLPELVRPGEIVNCSREDLGGAADKFDQLDPDPPVAAQPAPSNGLALIEREDGLYDILNQTNGRALNSRPMEKESARKLLEAIGASQGYDYKGPPVYPTDTVVEMERAW
jgi:hypothetical protein